jgi:hypoxanthine phosphoribosyltransferase
MGGEVSRWAQEMERRSGKPIIAMPLLRGGLFFFSDLVRAMSCSVEMSEIRSWAYDGDGPAKAADSVRFAMHDKNIAGRALLIVDDICDSGRTLQTLTAELKGLGASAVATAVLVRRLGVPDQFKPDWSAFEFEGKVWLVGYGMDNDGGYRNLSGVYTIQGTGG